MAKNNDDNTLLIVGAGIVAYLIYKNSNKPATTPASVVINTDTAAPEVATGNDYPIVFNKYNPDVKMLQKVLDVVQDGIIGKSTLAVWKKYNPLVTERFKLSNADQLKKHIAFVNIRRSLTNVL